MIFRISKHPLDNHTKAEPSEDLVCLLSSPEIHQLLPSGSAFVSYQQWRRVTKSKEGQLQKATTVLPIKFLKS